MCYFSLQIQSVEMMSLHKNTEDLFTEFFSTTTTDNYTEKVVEFQSEISNLQICSVVVEELSRMTDHIATQYLEDEADSNKFMDRYHLNSYCEDRKDFMMNNPVLLYLFNMMSYPEREIEILQKLIFEVAAMKVIKTHSESIDSPLLISSFYEEKKYEHHTKKQVFKPSLPYIVGSVIASVDLIVVCKALDFSEKRNYIFWNFEGCLSDGEIDWRTKNIRLVR